MVPCGSMKLAATVAGLLLAAATQNGAAPSGVAGRDERGVRWHVAPAFLSH